MCIFNVLLKKYVSRIKIYASCWQQCVNDSVISWRLFGMEMSKVLDFSTTKIASKSADTPLNFKRESLITPKSLKKEKFSLISLPHNVSFSDLATKMHPISVEGLENITGILGRLQENDDDNVSNEKSLTKCKTTGKPTDGALVWAHIAFFIEGKTEPFESSAFRGEAQVLKLDDVLPGILVAARSLYPGQCGQFLLPSDTMYGEHGSIGSIPKFATILLVLHSIRWIDAGALDRYNALDDSSKDDIEILKNIIENSNEAAAYYFSRNKYKVCLSFYKRTHDILSDIDKRSFYKKEMNSYKIRNFINMAVCYNKLEKPLVALCHLDEASVLENSKCNSKYLYTRGKSLMLLDRYEEAMNFFILALDIEPDNTEIGENLMKLDAIITKQKDQESYLKNIFKPAESKFDTHDDLSKNVVELCESLKTTSMACFPFPPCLLPNEEKKLETIAKSVDGIDVILQKLNDGGIQRYFIIKKNT